MSYATENKDVKTYVSDETYKYRLSACMKCFYKRKDNTCSFCGCPVVEKAKKIAEQCPRKNW